MHMDPSHQQHAGNHPGHCGNQIRSGIDLSGALTLMSRWKESTCTITRADGGNVFSEQ